MPSKLTSTSSRSRMSATTGCVVASWPCRYAQAFSELLKVVPARRLRHLGPEHVVLGDGDRAGVLHRTRVELGHEELVVLGERVRQVEELLEVGEALPRDVHDLVGVQVLRQRAAAVDAERDLPAVPAAQRAVFRRI